MAKRTLLTWLLACGLLTACAATVDNSGQSFNDLMTSVGSPAVGGLGGGGAPPTTPPPISACNGKW